MKLTILILGFLCTALASQVRYDNFKVYRVTPTTETQVQVLRNLEELNGGYSLWTQVGGVNMPVDVMVPPHLEYDFQDLVNLQKLNIEVFIDNVQKRIDNEKSRIQTRAFGWTEYYRLNNIYEWLESLEAEFPDTVSVIVGGGSYEGRDIKGVRVSFSPNNENNAVFIEGGIHAREWISPAVTTYILNEILRSSDPVTRQMAERYDWYIFPVFNPDGYEYTHTTNRMWRKTRVPYGTCYGADPNRNWGYQWNTGGASNNPCSDTFAGPNAFSEPETLSTSQFISSISSRLVAYISFHSYSQLLLFPYGHTTQNLDNYQELQEVGDKAAASLATRFGTQFRVGNVGATIYIASGGSMDWVKGIYGTRITYTYELRDLGNYGFILPPEQIIPSGLETMDSLVTLLNEFNDRA